ncbi:antibiotic biosynthesis monooxygenase [Pseudooceanicola sp. CBS1P-1]|uniref:Antibiotic biosynthesis monooxygenase n=1 Tax=Pseudooceanicola albus TaxID=2692189 RepID=A0A6L7FZL3_9RHOB|nr:MULTISPECIES: putative quinol monooxygenase [Pseudooceanicola]MBT9382713.1 antibiotic biosynthesis monooxygenase [Pseudooceanicola endophyticus]MXN17251.1 antibiotic biosynthesis monooxygenase [Pseudooceanicola albus]
MIRLSGRLICPTPEAVGRLNRHLPEHTALTRAEPGCLSFEVTPTVDPLVWRVEEKFTDRAAFDAHQARTGASRWAEVTADITRDYEISDTES